MTKSGGVDAVCMAVINPLAKKVFSTVSGVPDDRPSPVLEFPPSLEKHCFLLQQPLCPQLLCLRPDCKWFCLPLWAERPKHTSQKHVMCRLLLGRSFFRKSRSRFFCLFLLREGQIRESDLVTRILQLPKL